MSYDAANLAEALIAQISRGEAPYKKAACGDGEAGFQVRRAALDTDNTSLRPAGSGACYPDSSAR